MRLVIGKLKVPQWIPPAEGEQALHDQVLGQAAVHFSVPGVQFVINTAARRVYGVGPGLYPDLVALDGTETGVAWVMEVETPDTIVDEETWDRWRRMVETGYSVIIAVPSGFGDLVEDIAVRLGFSFGLLYEFRIATEGIAFEVPSREEDEVRA